MTIFDKALIAAAAGGLMMSAHTAAAQERDWLNDKRWFVTTQHGDADYGVTLESDAEWWGRVDDSSTTHALGAGYNVLPHLGVRVAMSSPSASGSPSSTRKPSSAPTSTMMRCASA